MSASPVHHPAAGQAPRVGAFKAAPPDPGLSPFRAAVVAATNKPARVITLPASAWAQTWKDRQTEDVPIGLRLYAEADAVQGRASAAQIAWKKHPQEADEDLRIAAFNGAVMAYVVARATCHPEDASLPFFGSHEGAVFDIVQVALTPQGVEYLFDEIEAMLIADGPTQAAATDDEIAWLAEALRSGAAWNQLPASTVRRLRRLLGRVVADLRGDETP